MLPRTTPAQRGRFYGDIEALIEPGFLSHPVTIGGVRMSFRSLGPGDLFMLRARVEGESSYAWQVWALATSVWMIGGHCLLGEYNAIPALYHRFDRLPRRLQDVLFGVVLGLFARQNRASEGIEAYLYEDQSRNTWRMLGPHPAAHAGVPGVERMGSNYVQRIWRSFNEFEDEKLRAERDWDGFKLVASTQAPKGMRKLEAKELQMKRDETARRQGIMDRFFYFRAGVVTRKGFLKDREGQGAVIAAPKSVEDLESEMRNWVEGRLDPHDQIVEAYKAQIKDRKAAHEHLLEERRQARAEAARQREVAGFEPDQLMVLTPGQLQQILADRGEGAPGIRRIYDSDRSAHYLDKYLNRKEQAGDLQVKDGRVVDPHARPDDAQRLQDLIQGRQVGFGSEPGGANTAPVMNPSDPRVQAYLAEQRQLMAQHGLDEVDVDPAAFGGRR